MKWILALLNWIKKIDQQVLTEYYIDQFLETENGKIASRELGSELLKERLEKTRDLLITSWLPQGGQIKDAYNFAVRSIDEMTGSQFMVSLFDEPLRLPYDNYTKPKEIESYMHLQTLVALSLSDQLGVLSKKIVMVILEEDTAIFEQLSAVTYCVWYVADSNRLHLEPEPVPCSMLVH